MVTTAHRTSDSESPLITLFPVFFPYSPHPDRRHLVPLFATLTRGHTHVA